MQGTGYVRVKLCQQCGEDWLPAQVHNHGTVLHRVSIDRHEFVLACMASILHLSHQMHTRHRGCCRSLHSDCTNKTGLNQTRHPAHLNTLTIAWQSPGDGK